MIMIGQQLVAEQVNLIPLQSFRENVFEGSIIAFLMKNRGPEISAMSGRGRARLLRQHVVVLACTRS